MPHPNGPLAEMGDLAISQAGFVPVAGEDEFEARNRTIAPTILLSSGRYFDFLNPASTPLSIDEIAHALSNLCRFTGHCSQFYSVAQHSVLVALLLPRELRRHGLLHDAVEAVLGDVSSPLKKLLPEYKAHERRIEAVILASFGIHTPMPAEVKHADLVALRTEQRDLMHRAGGLWTCLDGIQPRAQRIVPWSPLEARARFLAVWSAVNDEQLFTLLAGEP